MRELNSRWKIVVVTCKVALALAIVGYLVVKIQSDAGFSRLYREPKDWPFLVGALIIVLLAFTCSFVRWYLLVRGLGMEFHLRDAFRLGSLGFMLNQVMPGSVGGDLLKAAFIAHEQPGRRTEAVASVIIDRFVGLVAILLVASIALYFTGTEFTKVAWLQGIEGFVWSLAAVGLVGMLVLTSRLVSSRNTQMLVARIPIVGPALSRLVAGLYKFGTRRIYLWFAWSLALLTHCLFISAFWMISRGLPIDPPTLRQNSIVVPVALVMGAVPLTPGGLGLMETAVAQLYGVIGLNNADGAMVALAYRALTYVVAGIGACYYLSAKRRMDRLIKEAEELSETV